MAHETTVLSNALDTAIEDALVQMDEEQRDNFKAICAGVLAAYIHDDVHCLVLIGKSTTAAILDMPGLDVTHITSVNATDIQAAQIIAGAANQVSTIVMAEAPPRELFN